MAFILKRSRDGRIISQRYAKDGREVFLLAEPTKKGVLITEFDSDSQVLDQVYMKGTDPVSEIAKRVGIKEFEMEDVGDYAGVMVNSSCNKCGSVGLLRELDAHRPSLMNDVPVIPIFLCRKCGSRHYSLTDTYLKHLVSNNRGLFDEKELGEIDSDSEGAVKTLHGYIIRIFASKKISRIGGK